MSFQSIKKLSRIIIIATFVIGNSNNGYALSRIKIKNDSFTPNKVTDVKIKKELIISLDSIEDILEKNNLELKSERLKVEQNKLLLRSAIAARYPSLSLTSNGLPSYLDGYTYNTPDSSTNTLSTQLKASIQAEVKWDLINPLRKPEINKAKDEFEKSKLSYLIKLRNIKLQAIKEYYLFQQSIEEVKVAEKSIEYSLLALDEATVRLETGLGTKLELLEAMTQLARDKKMLSEKIGTKKIKQRNITSILNLPPTTQANIISDPRIIGLWKKSIEESVIYAYKYRKDLDEILLNVSINNNKAKLASGAKKPTISIYNNFSTSFTEGQTLVSSPDMNKKSSIINNTVGINATWNLVDGGKTKALYEYNQHKAKESKNDFQIKLAKIREEVETSYLKMKTEEKNIISTSNEVKTAEESLRLADLRFRSGITTQREIVNNQRDLTEAKVNHIKSITNYNIHLSELRRQTGIDEIKSCQSNKDLQIDPKESKLVPDLISTNLLPICK